MDSIILAPITESLVKINDVKNYLIVTAVRVTAITMVLSLRFMSEIAKMFVVVTILFLTLLASALLLDLFFILLRQISDLRAICFTLKMFVEFCI